MEKEKKKDIWQVGQVATQTSPVIVNTMTNKSLPIEEAIAKILNKLENIEKGVLG